MTGATVTFSYLCESEKGSGRSRVEGIRLGSLAAARKVNDAQWSTISRRSHESLVESRRKLTLSLMRKPRHGPCLGELPVGFCEPDAESSINSCLQRSSRLPANFNGPLTHGYRRFLSATWRLSFLFASTLRLHSWYRRERGHHFRLFTRWDKLMRWAGLVSSGSWDPATWRI